MLREKRVVETPLAGNLIADPRRQVDDFACARELHLGNDKSLVIPLKLIYLEGVVCKLYDVAHLVDYAAASRKQRLSHSSRNLAFPFETAQTSVVALALEGEYTFIIAYTHTRGNSATAEVALSNAHRTSYVVAKRVVAKKVFTFNLLHTLS